MRALTTALIAMAMLASCQSDPAVHSDAGDSTGTSPVTKSPPVQEAVSEPMSIITGSLSYMQRMALPNDAVATISVYEDGPADKPRIAVAEEAFALNGRQVPIPFEVQVDPGLETETGRLSLRATISDGAGALLWTSDTAMIFEAGAEATDLGLVRLVPTRAAVVNIDDLTTHEWMVVSINGGAPVPASQLTITFDSDGRISGKASCNAYTGSYKVNAGKLYVGPLALTRKACPPPLMAQEQAFVSILEESTIMRIGTDDVLVLDDGEGGSIAAR